MAKTRQQSKTSARVEEAAREANAAAQVGEPFVAAAAFRSGNDGAAVMAASPGEITQTQTAISTLPDGTTATTVVTTTTVTTTTTMTTTTQTFVTGEMPPIQAHQLEASAVAASPTAVAASPAARPAISVPFPAQQPAQPAQPAQQTARTAISQAVPAHARSTYKKPLAYRAIKRTFDLVFSALVIVIGFIPGLILSLAIAISTKGSPFYVQRRIKKGGKPFSILKFRTMVVDADNLEKHLTPEQIAEWHAEHKVANDPRITKLGGFLRRTSIDEFPNFLNVFAGQMSIVGPRAITEEELDYFGDDRGKLLSVPAGVTGWWQVSSRNDATFESGERQKLELFYIDHASLGFDTRIFFQTFAAVFSKTGK